MVSVPAFTVPAGVEPTKTAFTGKGIASVLPVELAGPKFSTV